MKYQVTTATPEDGIDMLKLIEAASAKGNIELIYTRRPNAYHSYLREGNPLTIGLVKTAPEGIVAQAACSVRDYWINGDRHSAGYVGGVRKKPGYTGRIPWGAVSTYIQETPCDLFYCSFLSDNLEALTLFTKKRSFIPELLPLGKYTTYIINPRAVKARQSKHLRNEASFRRITAGDLPAVQDFLSTEGRRSQFAPVVTDLCSEFSGLTLDDCFLLERNGEILAFGALWDQRDYKQYIVTRYRGTMKLFRVLSRLIERLGYIAMPPENEALAFPTLTLFYAKDDDPDYYEQFLFQIAQVIRQIYGMFIIGLSDRDPHRQVYEHLPTIHFDSQLFYVRHQADLTLNPELPVRFECGLL